MTRSGTGRESRRGRPARVMGIIGGVVLAGLGGTVALRPHLRPPVPLVAVARLDPPKAVARFCAVAAASSEIRVLPVEGKTFVLVSNGPAADYQPSHDWETMELTDPRCASALMEVSEDRVVHVPARDVGLECLRGEPVIAAMGGRWPESACIVQEEGRYRAEHHWMGSQWGLDPRRRRDLGCGVEGPWLGGALLSLQHVENFPMRYLDHKPGAPMYKLVAVGADLRELSPPSLGHMAADQRGPNEDAFAFGASSSGAFLIAWKHNEPAGRVTFERGTAGSPKTTLLDGPPMRGRPLRGKVVVRAAGDVDVLALIEIDGGKKVPYAVHVDERGAHGVEVPQNAVSDIALLADGTMIFLGDEIVRRAPGGAVTREPIGMAALEGSLFAPDTSEARLWAKSVEDLWIVAALPGTSGGERRGRVLLQACPAPSVARVPIQPARSEPPKGSDDTTRRPSNALR